MSPIHPLNFFLNFFFLQESSKCSNEGDYQSKVSQAQVLKTQPFLFVFMLPLGLFGVATVGSAVRGVKLLFWYGHYIYTWVCFKIDNLPTNIQFHSSGWLCIISGDWMQEESEGKKIEKAHLTQVLAFHAAFVWHKSTIFYVGGIWLLQLSNYLQILVSPPQLFSGVRAWIRPEIPP